MRWAVALLTVALAACNPTAGHLEVWNRMLDAVVVVAGGHPFRVAACDHVALDGVSLEGISLERVDGVRFGLFDVGGVRRPLHWARYLVLTADVAPLDLREPPTAIAACSGHIGELLS